MGRYFICRVALGTAVAYRFHAIDQCSAKRFQLHQFCLLRRNNFVEFVQQLVLVRQPCLEVNKAFLAHGYPLFAVSY